MISARADVVGSLLRPPELLEARRRFEEGGISVPEFKRAEDRAVDWAISLQERAGLPVVTDGELEVWLEWGEVSAGDVSVPATHIFFLDEDGFTRHDGSVLSIVSARDYELL